MIKYLFIQIISYVYACAISFRGEHTNRQIVILTEKIIYIRQARLRRSALYSAPSNCNTVVSAADGAIPCFRDVSGM